MKVITLDKERFTDACSDLASEVDASGFRPSLIIGIRSGGEYVAREMAGKWPGAVLEFVSMQRPSTSGKKKYEKLLSTLPLWILDLIRIAESWLLSLRKPRGMEKVCLLPTLEYVGKRNVLVVDDAVDSGATMLAVVDAIRSHGGDIDLRTAAITVTTRAPEIEPDFALFRNRTLIRFPWSMDAKR